MPKQSSGALAGWKRVDGDHGIVLTLQLVTSRADYRERAFDLVNVAINDRQLRSLTRDLIRASQTRGLDLRAPRPWWRFWASRDTI